MQWQAKTIGNTLLTMYCHILQRTPMGLRLARPHIKFRIGWEGLDWCSHHTCSCVVHRTLFHHHRCWQSNNQYNSCTKYLCKRPYMFPKMVLPRTLQVQNIRIVFRFGEPWYEPWESYFHAPNARQAHMILCRFTAEFAISFHFLANVTTLVTHFVIEFLEITFVYRRGRGCWTSNVWSRGAVVVATTFSKVLPWVCNVLTTT